MEEEDFVIELEESNVQQIINDVKIIEERFNEDSEIRLNKDQILIELTNLLNDASKLKSSLIEHKAYRFHDLLLSSDENQRLSHVIKTPSGNYTPIVDVLKNIMLTESDEVIDPEYEFDNDVKMAFQQNILKQFVNISKTTPWLNAIPKVQLLMNPWTLKKNAKGIKTTFEDSRDLVRGPTGALLTRTIAGDEMNVLGVILEGQDKTSKTTLSFDVQEYFDNLETLSEGQKVIVCFNDFFEDVTDDRCTHQTEVTKVIPGKGIQLRGPDVFIPFKKYSPVWVFPHKSSQYFNKRDIPKYRQCTVLFSASFNFHDNISFAVPLSASECIFMNMNTVKMLPNLKMIEKIILEPYSFKLDDLDYVTLSRIKKWLNLVDAQEIMTKHREYTPYKSSSKLNLLETLVKWKSYIETKEGLFTSIQLSSKRDAITTKINNLETHLKKLKSNDVCKNEKDNSGRVAMRINSYDKLMNLEKSDMYFQKQYDPTAYHIKDDIMKENPRITPEQVKSKVFDALQEKYAKMSQSELQFELKAIMKGKRRIRPGDIAILSVPSANLDIAFQYTEVDGSYMWIKILKTAFNMCDVSQDTCIFDTYDELCRSLEYAKANHQLKNIYQQQELLKDKVSSLSIIDDLIQKFTIQNKVVYTRSKPIVASIEAIEDDEYFGDVDYVDVDALFGNIENYDGEFAVLYQKNEEEEKAKLPVDDYEHTKELAALEFLCQLLGIDISPNEKKEVTVYAAGECKQYYKPLDKSAFIAKKFKNVNKKMYDENPGYRTKIDKLILEKYEAEVIQNNNEYFYHVILYMAAFLAALVMARYPRLVMTNVVSSCSGMLSYVGFPIKPKGYHTSIHNYMACVLIKTSLPEDERLSKFFESTQEKIRDELETQIENILKSQGKLAEMIEQNKHQLVVTKKFSQKRSPHEDVFEGFKPDLDKIGTMKASKILLKDALSAFEDVQVNTAIAKKDTPSSQFQGLVYKAPSYEIFKDDTSKYMKTIHQDHVEFVKASVSSAEKPLNESLKLFLQHKNDDDWWDTYVFEMVSNMLNNIVELIESSEVTLKMKAYIIYNERSLSSVNILHNFVTTSLISLLVKIKNRRVLKNDSIELKNIIFDALESPRLLNKIALAIENLAGFKNLWITDDIIKNHFVISHVFIETLVQSFYDDKLDIATKRLVEYICSTFVKTMDNNMLQEQTISKNMEALREKRKTELMDLYKSNDEDRRLQMTLKTFGLDTWYDVGNEGETGDGEEPKQLFVVIDEPTKEFYEDQGENADDDDES